MRRVLGLVLASVALAGACGQNQLDGADTRGQPRTLSEAFCNDLRSGLTPFQIWRGDVEAQYDSPGDFASDAYGMAAVSCPEQLRTNEVLRYWLSQWDIDPDT